MNRGSRRSYLPSFHTVLKPPVPSRRRNRGRLNRRVQRPVQRALRAPHLALPRSNVQRVRAFFLGAVEFGFVGAQLVLRVSNGRVVTMLRVRLPLRNGVRGAGGIQLVERALELVQLGGAVLAERRGHLFFERP